MTALEEIAADHESTLVAEQAQAQIRRFKRLRDVLP